MTPEERTRLRRLAGAATPGEWVAFVLGSEGYAVLAPPDPAGNPLRRLRVAFCGHEAWEVDKANAAFIAAARNAVPALLAELEQAEKERQHWVQRLSALCDDDWLRRRDRAMELPGVKGHRWERKASSAWETAARHVRELLNELANYEDDYTERHARYVAWLRAGRDEGVELAEGEDRG